MKNPYDGRFQDLAEDHPRLLLRMVRAIAPGTDPAIQRIPRRLRFNPVELDHGYLLRDGKRKHVVHIEAFARWKEDRAPVLSLYNLLLKQRYKTGVDSVILLMLQKYAPREVPGSLVWIDKDGQRIETPYRTVRLWEDVDAAIAFEPGCEALLDWVPWMRSGYERMEEALEKIESLPAAPYPPKVMAHNLALAAASRYPEVEIAPILERLRSKSMLLTIDIFKDSWVYKDGVAEGEAKGRVEGRLEGEREGRVQGELEGLARGKRDLILGLLARRFPGIPRKGIERITDPSVLDRLFADLLDAVAPDQAAAAIARATASR